MDVLSSTYSARLSHMRTDLDFCSLLVLCDLEPFKKSYFFFLQILYPAVFQAICPTNSLLIESPPQADAGHC